MARSIYIVRLVEEPVTPDALQAFENPSYAAAYEGALTVAGIESEGFDLPINDQAETAERIRETIAHLADKNAKRG